MNKTILASSIALAITTPLLFAADQSSNNQSSNNKSANDDQTLVVTANRVSQNINDTLAHVEILTRDDIEQIQPQSTIDLLRSFSGVDLTQSGGHAQSASLYTRGGNSGHTLVLIDGVRVGSATLGTKPLNDIPTSQIERIEFVKGPRAALWGSDALTGVIQIFTRRMNHGEYQVSATIGSNNAKHGNASVGFGNNKVNNTFTVSSEHSEGFDVLNTLEEDDDGYRRISAALRGDYQLSEQLMLDWILQHDEGNSEFDYGFTTDNPHPIESDYANSLLNIRYAYTQDNWYSELAVKGSRDETIQYGVRIPKDKGNVIETERQQINGLISNQLTDAIELTAGYEWLRDDVEGSTTDFPVTKRSTNSIYMSGLYNQNNWLGELSVRHDDVEAVDKVTTHNASVGYRISDRHLLSISQAKGFKAPTFNDLYFPTSPYSSGNPDLKPEYSDSREISFKWFGDNKSMIVSAYDMTIEDLIVWGQDANFFYTPENVAKAEIQGVDWVMSFNAGNLNHKVNASYIKAEDGETGDQLNRRAKRLAGYQVSADVDAFNLFAKLNYIGERHDNGTPLDSYTKLDLGIGYLATKDLIIRLTINDVTDEEVITLNNYNPIGREAYLGFTYHPQ
ncbi:TonB-dependent receptor domain-containing protein [Pleionea mediterranea]|uniref:Vitamin B12 transporter n=1 Tax=Pleionea mediterranea TaxID=523701 RepID=A0A316FD81_9GAMM|nr:TonB-dependent receptor [Pleionea mediterranea]PWK46359.1 vitamin B12 transporter [Pleionea mediterranea]